MALRLEGGRRRSRTWVVIFVGWWFRGRRRPTPRGHGGDVAADGEESSCTIGTGLAGRDELSSMGAKDTKSRRTEERLHHRFHPWAMLLLLGPALHRRLGGHRPSCHVTGGLPAYVRKGMLVTGFNTIHAGCSMDQPTIGKWLIWFLVLTVLSVPLIALTRWLGDRSSQLGYWAFGVPVLAIGGLLLSVLILPLCMLVQYVYWMGSPRNACSGSC